MKILSAEQIQAWRSLAWKCEDALTDKARTELPLLCDMAEAAPLLQAKIDALMLEYCPDEMTPEQIENWKRNQRAVTPEDEAKINSALHS